MTISARPDMGDRGKTNRHLSWLTALEADEDPAIGSREMHLAIYLYRRFNRETTQCNPSTARMMKDTRLSEATLIRARRSLTRLGWLQIEQLPGHQSMLYTLTFPVDNLVGKAVDDLSKTVIFADFCDSTGVSR